MVKVNVALKTEYRLNMLKNETKNNAYIAKNDFTGEKTKPYLRNTIMLLYHFHNLQIKDTGFHCFIELLKTLIACESIFLVQKIYRF